MHDAIKPSLKPTEFAGENMFEVEELEQRLENAWYTVTATEEIDRDTGDPYTKVTVGT